MDLILDQKDPFNTTLRGSDNGPAVYSISTQKNLLGLRNTTFFKREGDLDVEFGVVERRNFHKDALRVGGQEVKHRANSKDG
jgi:hypothetical protein